MAYTHYILVCGGTGCESSNAGDIYNNLIAEAKNAGVLDKVQIVKTGCFGFCEKGPIVKVLPEDSFYVEVKPEDAKEIIQEQIVKGREVNRLLYNKEKKSSETVEEIQFYQKQLRIVLRNCGVINPENIEEYIARDGYLALEKALFELSPQQIIDEVKLSGLRGRGGAGFPTGMKWEAGMKAPGDEKFVVCNADEGDPGAYMDRSTIEGDPHSVIEAMTICGKAIGSHQGFVYIRAEYPLAVDRLKIALNQARENGLLGKNILGSGFDFDIEIRLGAGAFVCGEETALLTSIEGNRGEPRPRPPFPAVKGLFGKPTLINNVETYANIPQIILNGAEWFASMGTEKSKGTKIFALGGKIKHTGLVEIPMGTPLRTIIEEIGGGCPNGKKFKAVQTGGPSGGCIPASLIDTSVDYDTLTSIGCMMGSGGMIVMDEDNCMVDIAKFFLGFIVDESCGKCIPCRIGTRRMLDILTKITEGKGEPGDIEKLEELANTVRATSLCGLGQTAPNPVLATLKFFRDEYEAHVYEKRCPAGHCKALAVYTIDPEKCKGCSLCSKKCPVGCISGVLKSPYVIDQSKCIKCGTCFEVCKFGAISKK
jgi:NADH:ubiquinone oxidoreductase subunit F (NADH-binding)/(2Fe-2S) ferredoxin